MNGQCYFPYGTLPSGLSDLHGKKRNLGSGLFKKRPHSRFKDVFCPRNDCVLHECHSICQVFQKKASIYIYVYMEVETIDCSKQIWDLLTALVLGLHGNFWPPAKII